jgi:soluble lytic murein transglycosylase-like protein
VRVRGLQLAGALVAVGTLLAAWVLPQRAAETTAVPEVAAVVTAPEDAPTASPPAQPQAPRAKAQPKPKPRHASMDWVEKVLARKMPGVAHSERLRLARAILEESRFAALDPLFVVALIAVESGFDHGAESVRGARGLMQLRQSTLETEAERSNLDGDLDDPVTNVRAGVRYYNRLLRAFGDHELALMAYNAGPNRILRYLREDGEVPERFQKYPQKVNAEISKLKKGGVPAGAGPAPVAAAPAPLGPVPAPPPSPLSLGPLLPAELAPPAPAEAPRAERDASRATQTPRS